MFAPKSSLPAWLQVPGLRGIAELSCGGLHTLALRHGGQVLAWGANQNGVLGLGGGKLSKQTARRPEPVPGLEAEGVSAGWKHSAAVAGHGRLLTWGWGGSQGRPRAHCAIDARAGWPPYLCLCCSDGPLLGCSPSLPCQSHCMISPDSPLSYMHRAHVLFTSTIHVAPAFTAASPSWLCCRHGAFGAVQH